MELAQQYLTPRPAASPAAPATLYLWGISPFCYKVLLAAAHKGVALDTRVASLADCLEARRRTGQRKIPFLVTADRWITDSSAICAWLESWPGPSLLPEGAEADCLLLEDWADEALRGAAEPWIWVVGAGVPRLQRLCADEQTHTPTRWITRAAGAYMRRVWTARVEAHGGPEATRRLLLSQLDLLERRLGGRPWLFGEAPTLADYAVAAQLANLVRFGCSADLDARPATAALVRRAIARLPWAAP